MLDLHPLDYGALGLAFVILGYVIHVLNKVIRLHNEHMDRLITLIEAKAVADTKLAKSVEDLVDVVHDKLSATRTPRGG